MTDPDDVNPPGTSDSSRAAARVLTFIQSAGDVPPPRIGWRNVVLDPTWTPEPGGRPDVTSIRAYGSRVVERHDLFGEALAGIDRWGDATGMADRLVVEGAAYWFRVREPLWHWAHERLYWRLVLAAIEDQTPFDAVVVPEGRLALIDVVRGLGRPLEIRRRTLEPRPTTPSVWRRRQALRGLARTVLRRVRRRLKALAGSREVSERGRNSATLDDRVDWLSQLEGPRVLVVTHPGSYHKIGSAGAGSDEIRTSAQSFRSWRLSASRQSRSVGAWTQGRRTPGRWSMRMGACCQPPTSEIVGSARGRRTRRALCCRGAGLSRGRTICAPRPCGSRSEPVVPPSCQRRARQDRPLGHRRARIRGAPCR